MAETTEKGKTAKRKVPAKPRAPRATAGTKKTAVKKVDGAAIASGAAAAKAPYVPTHNEIAFLALKYWEQRGREHGNHVQDWLRAEQDLLKMAS